MTWRKRTRGTPRQIGRPFKLKGTVIEMPFTKEKFEKRVEWQSYKPFGKAGEPKFETYDDALKWIELKAKEYGGRKPFYDSLEYRQRYNEIKMLGDIARERYFHDVREEATKAMAEVNAKVGQRVEYSVASPWGQIEEQEGIIVLDKEGIPKVKLDDGKKVKWHKGFRPIKPSGKAMSLHPLMNYDIENIIRKATEKFDIKHGVCDVWVFGDGKQMYDGKHIPRGSFYNGYAIGIHQHGGKLALSAGDVNLLRTGFMKREVKSIIAISPEIRHYWELRPNLKVENRDKLIAFLSLHPKEIKRDLLVASPSTVEKENKKVKDFADKYGLELREGYY